MSQLQVPAGYVPLLNLKQTELGIKNIKDFFSPISHQNFVYVV